MKKIYLLLAVAVITIAASCTDESKNKGSKEMKHNEKEMKDMKK